MAGVSLILEDQAIEDVSARTQVLLKETIRDLATPLQGGWKRCVEDLLTGLKLAFPAQTLGARAGSSKRLGFEDLLDAPLLAAAPVSLLRYPAAWLLRSPLPVLSFCLAVAAVSCVPDVFAQAALASAAESSQGSGLGIQDGMSLAERLHALSLVDAKVLLSSAASAGSGVLLIFGE